MRRLILLSTLVVLFSSVFAQQETMLSQYMYNQYSINPAVAGTKDYMPISMVYRRLWTGIDDAPTLHMASGHTSISDEMAVGAKLYNYSTGPNSKTGIEASYAYSFKAYGDAKISIGISAVLNQYYLDKSKLKFEVNDPTMNTGSEKLLLPDANFGAYLFDKNYYFGIASHQLFDRKVSFLNDNLEQRQVRHYYIHGGYNYEINKDIAIEPSAMLKMIEAGELQVDINAKLEYKKVAFIGFSYRTQDAAVVMLGINQEKIQFGYAYDITLSDLKKYSLGSHEIMFIYKIK